MAGIESCGEKMRLLNLFPLHPSVNGVHAPLARSFFASQPKKSGEIRLLNLFPINDSSPVVDNIDAPAVVKSRFTLPSKKRLRLMGADLSVNFQAPEANNSRSEDSSKNTEYVREFASEREEEVYYAEKIQKLHEEMRDKFGRERGLATKKLTKRCSRFHDELVPMDNYVENKKKIKMSNIPRVTATTNDDDNNNNNIKTDEEKLRNFITGDEIKGSDMKLLIQKKLYESDLKRDQNRLNMPIKKLRTQDFLKSEEKQILNNKDDNSKVKGIEVGLVGPKLQMYKKPMVLKLWKMRKNKYYVLMTNWKDFVTDNIDYLQEERVIRVWSFRRDQQLCFAISIV